MPQRVTFRIATYDFAACRQALQSHAQELVESAEGLARWASFRQFIEAFAREAHQHRACVLGQFDPDLVFAFVPIEGLTPTRHEALWADLLAEAADLMGDAEVPLYWFDFLDALTGAEGTKADAVRYSWMDSDLLQNVLIPRRLAIWVFFNAHHFLETVLRPQLEKRGFEVLPDDSDERSPLVRVRHPNRPHTVYKIPWSDWLRHMVGGGFNMLYLLGIISLYLQKLELAVGATHEKESE